MNELAISEGDLKQTVTDYLTYGSNQGKWLWFRLNAGSFILTDKDGNFRRRVQGAKAGTADFIVIRSSSQKTHFQRVNFLELKSAKGRQSLKQKEFQQLVESQRCGYHIIRSPEELEHLLNGETL